jgi:hypothetical protein
MRPRTGALTLEPRKEVTVQFPDEPSGRSRICHLDFGAGRIAECPRDSCSFWETGTAVLEPGCAIERLGLPLELERNPALAHWLLKMRASLDDRHQRDERQRLLVPLPPGLHE